MFSFDAAENHFPKDNSFTSERIKDWGEERQGGGRGRTETVDIGMLGKRLILRHFR